MKVAATGGVPTTLVAGRSSPEQLLVTGNDLYWVDYGAANNRPNDSSTTSYVMTASTAGGTPVTIATAAGYTPTSLASHGGYLYWLTEDGANQTEILRAPAGGGTPTVFLRERYIDHSITNLAVDDTSMYWTVGATGQVKKNML
jgi:hypothetical protein